MFICYFLFFNIIWYSFWTKNNLLFKRSFIVFSGYFAFLNDKIFYYWTLMAFKLCMDWELIHHTNQIQSLLTSNEYHYGNWKKSSFWNCIISNQQFFYLTIIDIPILQFYTHGLWFFGSFWFLILIFKYIFNNLSNYL